MAMLKQGNAYFVPWADIAEWKDVREKILSDNVDDLIRAYEIIIMWKYKSSNLPAFIECTAGILQVMVQEHKMSYSTGSYLDNILFKEYDLRLAYSTALIRFVNHVYSVSDSKYQSLYRAAKVQNIPDWIITMRHDAAHGRELPALETLHMAAKISLQWLLKNYWLQEAVYMSDFQSSGKVTGEYVVYDKLSLMPVYDNSIKIWKVCSDAIKNSLIDVSQLPADQFQYITKLVDLCHKNDFIMKHVYNSVTEIEKFIKFSGMCTNKNAKKLSLLKLRVNIQSFIRILSYAAASKDVFAQSLLQSDFMLDVNGSQWNKIIKNIQHMRGLEVFIKLLFQFAENGNENALKLLIKLAPCVAFLKTNWPVYVKLHRENVNASKGELRRIVTEKSIHNQKNLPFSLVLQRSPKIRMDMLYDLLLNPLNYPLDLIFEYLNLLERPIPEPLYEMITKLVRIYCAAEPKEESISETNGLNQIYTIEDLELDAFYGNKEAIPSMENLSEGRVWNESTVDVNEWNKCPIGLAPHQTYVDCSLPQDLKWKVKSTVSSKRRLPSSPLMNHASEMKRIRA